MADNAASRPRSSGRGGSDELAGATALEKIAALNQRLADEVELARTVSLTNARLVDQVLAENQRLREENERLRPLADIGAEAIRAGHVSVAGDTE